MVKIVRCITGIGQVAASFACDIDLLAGLLVFFKDQQLDIFKATRDDMGWSESSRKTWLLKDGSFVLTHEEDLPDQYGEDNY